MMDRVKLKYACGMNVSLSIFCLTMTGGVCMARLSDPITILKGIGPAKAKSFAQLNIVTLGDLICHFPRGYEDRTTMVAINRLEADQPACFRAVVMNTPRTNWIRKGLEVTLELLI